MDKNIIKSKEYVNEVIELAKSTICDRDLSHDEVLITDYADCTNEVFVFAESVIRLYLQLAEK